MTGTTRIPAVEITGFKGALIKRFAKRTLGQVPSSLGVYWHNPKVLMSMAGVGGKIQTREVVAGDGYAQQSALRLHFGLGERTAKIDEMVVRWPASGTVQRFRNVPVDRIVEITEGGRLVEKRYGAGQE